MKRSELLILVALLGIIASYAVPRYLQYRRRGAMVEAMASLDRIASAAQTYFARSARVAKKAPGLPASAPGWAPTQLHHERCAKGQDQFDIALNAVFSKPPWSTLSFAPIAPLANRYLWLVRRQATAKRSAQAVAYALGDPACSGQLSRWRMTFISEGSKLHRRGPELVAGLGR